MIEFYVLKFPSIYLAVGIAWGAILIIGRGCTRDQAVKDLAKKADGCTMKEIFR